ncbi:MAG: PEP-utilizing enzyme [Candidatus Micrarchaeota archaeon]
MYGRIDMDLKALETDLSAVIAGNPSFGSGPLLLSRTENSDLLEISKECSQEFFGRVFAPQGPLWGMYLKARLASLPKSATYLNFIAGRMYFLRNVEMRYMRFAGMEKIFLWGGESVLENASLTPKNAILLITSPFEMLSQALDISLLPLYVNEKLAEFALFRERTIRFYAEHKNSSANPAGLASDALGLAVESMHFSFVSSLGATFNSRLKDSSAWKECESELLFNLVKDGDVDAAIREFGFHSVSPYDISIPRFHEDLAHAIRAPTPFPKNPHARWRENAKFCCSRYLDLMRDAYIAIGEESGIGLSVFHLKTSELQEALTDPRKWKGELERRKKLFYALERMEIPPSLVYAAGKWHEPREKTIDISGIAAGAPGNADGLAVLIDADGDFRKDVSGRIIVSRSFSPNLAPLLMGAKGIVSSSGGLLSHAAIIARESGIPCIVQAKNLERVRDGDAISIDGKTGKILLA